MNDLDVLDFLVKLLEYVKQQKAILMKNYPEEVHGICVLNYIQKVFLKDVEKEETDETRI